MACSTQAAFPFVPGVPRCFPLRAEAQHPNVAHCASKSLDCKLGAGQRRIVGVKPLKHLQDQGEARQAALLHHGVVQKIDLVHRCDME